MKKTFLLVPLVAIILIGCSKTEDPAPAGAGSPSSSQTVPAKPARDEDLARMRELMEKEESRKTAAEQSSREFGAGVKKGGAAPIRELKY